MVVREAWDCLKRKTVVCIIYSTIETKGAACIGYYGFLFPLSTNAEIDTRYIQYGQLPLFQ